MAVTITGKVQTGPRTWVLTWSSSLSDPTYYIYIDGTLAEITTRTSRTFTVGIGEQESIEILDSQTTPATAYPGRLVLSWNPVDGAKEYKVKEYSGGAWVTRKTIPETGRSFYSYRTRWLADETQYQWRVVPVGENAIEGLPRPFTVTMVRRPDVPSLGYSYDSGTRQVTFSAS